MLELTKCASSEVEVLRSQIGKLLNGSTAMDFQKHRISIQYIDLEEVTTKAKDRTVEDA